MTRIFRACTHGQGEATAVVNWYKVEVTNVARYMRRNQVFPLYRNKRAYQGCSKAVTIVVRWRYNSLNDKKRDPINTTTRQVEAWTIRKRAKQQQEPTARHCLKEELEGKRPNTRKCCVTDKRHIPTNWASKWFLIHASSKSPDFGTVVAPNLKKKISCNV